MQFFLIQKSKNSFHDLNLYTEIYKVFYKILEFQRLGEHNNNSRQIFNIMYYMKEKM